LLSVACHFAREDVVMYYVGNNIYWALFVTENNPYSPMTRKTG